MILNLRGPLSAWLLLLLFLFCFVGGLGRLETVSLCCLGHPHTVSFRSLSDAAFSGVFHTHLTKLLLYFTLAPTLEVGGDSPLVSSEAKARLELRNRRAWGTSQAQLAGGPVPVPS